MIKILFKIEGFVVLGLSIYFYSYLQFSWLIFIILLFVPDLSALGYLKNNKIGAILYNLCHTYSVPAVLIICGLLLQNNIFLMISLIWIAHIGMDRMVGYGLKYPTKFHDTHFDRI